MANNRILNQFYQTIPYIDLKPGMICEEWDNAGEVVKEAKVIERPGMRYNFVKVVFKSGVTVKATEGCKMTVRK